MMNTIMTLLTIADVLIALMLIALILVQQSKSVGLGTTFGGGGADSLFGAHAGSQLSKLTVIFASFFLIITLAMMVISAHRPKERSLAEKVDADIKASSSAKAPAGALPITVGKTAAKGVAGKTATATTTVVAPPAKSPAPVAVKPIVTAPIKVTAPAKKPTADDGTGDNR